VIAIGSRIIGRRLFPTAIGCGARHQTRAALFSDCLWPVVGQHQVREPGTPAAQQQKAEHSKNVVESAHRVKYQYTGTHAIATENQENRIAGPGDLCDNRRGADTIRA
jgi:hypothetical protein